jgi:hypothetical protein
MLRVTTRKTTGEEATDKNHVKGKEDENVE